MKYIQCRDINEHLRKLGTAFDELLVYIEELEEENKGLRERNEQQAETIKERTETMHKLNAMIMNLEDAVPDHHDAFDAIHHDASDAIFPDDLPFPDVETGMAPAEEVLGYDD